MRITPEVWGALSLAEHHLKMASGWHWRETRWPWSRRRIIAKHRSKAQKLLARAMRLSDRRSVAS